jgi:phosphonate degradation associated HDIG domain protein
VALTVPQIVNLYRTEGAARYGMEGINQEQHAFQCALLAEQAGSPPELVAAALLHDLGHLLCEENPEVQCKDGLHEYRALPFLRGEYPDAVLQPIRLHVAAKRFLCVMDATYWDTLSAASRRSLELQGGPLNRQEMDRFLAEPHAMEAVALRRWDDLAKCATVETPGWEHYRPLLERVALRQPERLPA